MIEGTCRLCGVHGPLSFEHVPPKAAFNDRRVTKTAIEMVVDRLPSDRVVGKIVQRGRGDYTLCERCNNSTGSWYARAFTDWCYQAMDILVQADGRPTLSYMQYLFPLQVIKQVVTMFFSVNHSGFRHTYPELEAFVLNRHRRYLNPRVRIFAYYNVEGVMRSSQIIVSGSKKSPGDLSVFSETNFPPFGFVMTYDSHAPDDRLVDISHFANYDYQEFKVMPITLPVLPTHLWVPGDYRTEKEIQSAYLRNAKMNGDTDSDSTMEQ